MTVLSVEDLSVEWLDVANKEKILSILQFYANLSDIVIAVSDKLKSKLRKVGIEATVVRPGLERILVNFEEAVKRKEHPHILLHAGQVQFEEEEEAFKTAIEQVLNRYLMMAYSRGKSVHRMRSRFPKVLWYNYATLEEATQNLKKCSVGLVIRFRAHNPTRLYFHASMLQPIIAIGDNWIEDVASHSIGVITQPIDVLEGMERIVSNYPEYVRAVQAYAAENTLEKTYAPLIRALEK
jgi:hypothetical protein